MMGLPNNNQQQLQLLQQLGRVQQPGMMPQQQGDAMNLLGALTQMLGGGGGGPPVGGGPPPPQGGGGRITRW